MRDRITGNPLGGPAVHLTLLPADLNPRMSSFHIRGWEVTGGRPTVAAGADMQLTLAIYDVYGNAGRVREENIVAHASGAQLRHCIVHNCAQSMASRLVVGTLKFSSERQQFVLQGQGGW